MKDWREKGEGDIGEERICTKSSADARSSNLGEQFSHPHIL